MRIEMQTTFRYNTDVEVEQHNDQPYFVELSIEWGFIVSKKDTCLKCDVDVTHISGYITGEGFHYIVNNPHITIEWDGDAERIDVREIIYNHEKNTVLIKF